VQLKEKIDEKFKHFELSIEAIKLYDINVNEIILKLINTYQSLIDFQDYLKVLENRRKCQKYRMYKKEFDFGKLSYLYREIDSLARPLFKKKDKFYAIYSVEEGLDVDTTLELVKQQILQKVKAWNCKTSYYVDFYYFNELPLAEQNKLFYDDIEFFCVNEVIVYLKMKEDEKDNFQDEENKSTVVIPNLLSNIPIDIYNKNKNKFDYVIDVEVNGKLTKSRADIYKIDNNDLFLTHIDNTDMGFYLNKKHHTKNQMILEAIDNCLNNIDNKALQYIFSHADRTFIESGVSLIRESELVLHIYETNSTKNNKAVKSSLQKMAKLNLSRVDSSGKGITFNLFASVDTDRNDGYIEVIMNPVLKAQLLTNQTINLYREAIDGLKSSSAQALLIPLQQERLKLFSSCQKREIGNIPLHIPFGFFRGCIRFQNQRKSVQYKTIEEGLQEMKEKGFIVKDFCRKKGDYYINFEDVSFAEIENFVDVTKKNSLLPSTNTVLHLPAVE
jgi:hypothetical protein